MSGFKEDYWKQNYSEPQTMDAIGNAKDHVAYIKAYFNLENVDISSIADLGFGHGVLFRKVMKAFLPYKALGIEPSEFIFKKAQVEKWRPVPSTELTLLNIDLKTWCQQSEDHIYDLGICMSVFQYIKDQDLKLILPVLAKRFRYLYFTVPTDIEYKRQLEDHQFADPWAIQRTQSQYLKLIRPYFTFVSNRILESKLYFDETNSHFSELLYRF
ncbi:MAG: class I SAM-dependent methyltransferase [Candidatus Caldatribacteriota bacterium]